MKPTVNHALEDSVIKTFFSTSTVLLHPTDQTGYSITTVLQSNVSTWILQVPNLDVLKLLNPKSVG